MTQESDRKQLVRERMAATGETYTAASAALEAEQERLDAAYAKVVRAFFDGPRLRSVPTKRKARVVVLLELLRRFEPVRPYPEKEVVAILQGAHEDHAYLRRELVDYGYLTRADGVYQVAESLPVRDPNIVQEMPADEARRFRATRDERFGEG